MDSTEMCLDELRRTQSWSSLGCYSSSLIYCSFLSYELWSEEKKGGGKKSQAKVRETDADGEEENNNKQVKEAKEEDEVYNHLLKGSEGKLSIKAEDCDDKAAPRDTILQRWQKKRESFPTGHLNKLKQLPRRATWVVSYHLLAAPWHFDEVFKGVSMQDFS